MRWPQFATAGNYGNTVTLTLASGGYMVKAVGMAEDGTFTVTIRHQ